MEWVETTGKSLDDAKEEALRELGVGEEDAEFVVVAEPKAGLFGRVRTEARVRARVRPTRPRAKEDRRDRKRRPSRAGGAGADPVGGGDRQDEAAGGVVTVERTDGDGYGGDDEAHVPLAEQAEVARSFLAGLLEQFGARATVTVTELDPDTVEVAVQGEDLALLIGPRGATVGALQDLARTVVQRRTGARHGRLLVDVGGYRQKRKAALERFSRQVAEQVLSTGREQVLEAMEPSDRKVVHDTVNQIDGVATRSEGEDPRRRVIILPVS
ncbi:MAG: RNA-binding cell elongation regulator Jag/EloR [Acidimicrobiales bacterium]